VTWTTTSHPANTIRLVQALIKANKRFDFMILPGKPHAYGDMVPYTNHLMFEYFAEHLLNDYYRKDATIGRSSCGYGRSRGAASGGPSLLDYRDLVRGRGVVGSRSGIGGQDRSESGTGSGMRRLSWPFEKGTTSFKRSRLRRQSDLPGGQFAVDRPRCAAP
jgi:hypothetical protein